MIEVTSLNHVSLVVNDLDASRHFYGEVLSMAEAPRPDNFRFAGAWFRQGSAELHLIQRAEAVQDAGDAPVSPTETRNISYARHFCLAIADDGAALEALAAHDVPVVHGPRNRGDGATQIYIYDPDGHMIELVCLTPTRELAIDWKDWAERS